MLDAVSGAQAMAAVVQAQFDRQATGMPLFAPDEMAAKLAGAYDAYARQAILLGADMSAGGNLGALEDAYLTVGAEDAPERLAKGFCDYWAGYNAPAAVPEHGGLSVVSVTVNAAVVEAAMASALRGLITGQELPSPYLRFIQSIEAVVKTIPCIVVELMPGTPPTPQAFPEWIS